MLCSTAFTYFSSDTNCWKYVMQPYSSGMKYSLGYDRSLVSTYNYCSQASVRKWINRGRLHDTCRAEMHGVLNYCWPRFQCTVAEPLLWYKLKMVSRSQCVWLWNLHVCRKCYTCTRVCERRLQVSVSVNGCLRGKWQPVGHTPRDFKGGGGIGMLDFCPMQ